MVPNYSRERNMLHRIRQVAGVGKARAIGLFVLGVFSCVVMIGCQPPASPTMPPAIAMGPFPATPTVTVVPPTATSVPTVLPEPTVPAPTTEPTDAPKASKPVKLTILHVNDVAGEVDPCG